MTVLPQIGRELAERRAAPPDATKAVASGPPCR